MSNNDLSRRDVMNRGSALAAGAIAATATTSKTAQAAGPAAMEDPIGKYPKPPFKS